MRTSQRLTATLLAVGAAALLGACGDDSGGTADARPTPDAPGTPDARNPDAAPPPTPTRAAQIALTEVKLTTPGATTFGGAAISMSVEDLTTGGGTTVVDTGVIGCNVTTYDCPGGVCPFHPTVDAGPIQLTNPTAATPGIVGLTPPQCVFQNGAYRCPVGTKTDIDGAVAPSTALGPEEVFTFTGETFDPKLRGTFVVMTGLDGTAAALNNRPLPVTDAAGATLTVGGATGLTEATLTDVGMTFLQGVSPVPTGAGVGPRSAIDFLNDSNPATELINIKLAGSETNGFPSGVDITLGAAGSGFTLDTACTNCKSPEAMPTSVAAGAPNDGAAAIFSCAAPGNCGSTGIGGANILTAFAVSGVANNGSTTTTGLQRFQMPTEGVTKSVSFTCAGTMNQITISNEVWRAVLSIAPTRIETRVFRIAAPLPSPDRVSNNTARVLAGHGFIGHTDVPPPPQ